MISNKYIDKFPLNSCQTPYNNNDFNNKTTEYCKSTINKGCVKAAKVIVLGDVSVGKTCLVNRFCYQSFNSNYKATIGVDFEVQHFHILGVPFHLQIWDTAGQERFQCIAQSYYRSAHAIVIVFDLSTIYTLNTSKKWLNDALQASSPEPHIFLVGTKKDLLSQAALEAAENIALNTANKLKAEYWSVSSKTSENINELFSRIAALTFDSIIANDFSRQIQISKTGIISLETNKSEKCQKKHCCDL